MDQAESLFIWTADDKGNWIRKDAGGVRRFFNDVNKGLRDAYRGTRETLAPGRSLKEMWSGKYREKMEKLREVDDQIKSWVDDLDNCLDRARDAKKQGRLVDFAKWVEQIAKRLKLVSDARQEFTSFVTKDFYDFYSKTEEDWDLPEGELLRRAGVIDGLGREVANWQMRRMHRKQLDKQEAAARQILSITTTVVGSVNSMLGEMSKARADGDVDNYRKALEQISRTQSTFEKQFKPLYTTHLKPLVDHAERKKREEAAAAAANQPVEELSEESVDEAAEGEAAPPESIQPASERVSGGEDARIDPVAFTPSSQYLSDFSNFLAPKSAPEPAAAPATVPGAPIVSPTPAPAPQTEAMPPAAAPTQPSPGPATVVPSTKAESVGEVKSNDLLSSNPPAPAPAAAAPPAAPAAPAAGPRAPRAPSSTPRPPRAPGGKRTTVNTPATPAEPTPLLDLSGSPSGTLPEPEPEPGPEAGSASATPTQQSAVDPPPPPPAPAKPGRGGRGGGRGAKTVTSSEVGMALLRQSNENFFKEMIRVASLEDPFLLAGLLTKHSEAIEDLDSDQASELLDLAEEILNVK